MENQGEVPTSRAYALLHREVPCHAEGIEPSPLGRGLENTSCGALRATLLHKAKSQAGRPTVAVGVGDHREHPPSVRKSFGLNLRLPTSRRPREIEFRRQPPQVLAGAARHDPQILVGAVRHVIGRKRAGAEEKQRLERGKDCGSPENLRVFADYGWELGFELRPGDVGAEGIPHGGQTVRESLFGERGPSQEAWSAVVDASGLKREKASRHDQLRDRLGAEACATPEERIKQKPQPLLRPRVAPLGCTGRNLFAESPLDAEGVAILNLLGSAGLPPLLRLGLRRLMVLSGVPRVVHCGLPPAPLEEEPAGGECGGARSLRRADQACRPRRRMVNSSPCGLSPRRASLRPGPGVRELPEAPPVEMGVLFCPAEDSESEIEERPHSSSGPCGRSSQPGLTRRSASGRGRGERRRASRRRRAARRFRAGRTPAPSP